MTNRASGRGADHGLAPGHVRLELDHARVAGAADRGLDERAGAPDRGRALDLAPEDAGGELDRLGEPGVLLGLVRSSSQRALSAPMTPETVMGDTSSTSASVIVWPVSLASTPCTSIRSIDGRLLGAAGEPLAVLAPDQAEARVADAVLALARAALLVVVEVARRGVRLPADVDADVGGRLRLRVARADDLERPVRELEHGDREHVVGVEVPWVRGDLHASRMTPSPGARRARSRTRPRARGRCRGGRAPTARRSAVSAVRFRATTVDPPRR